MQTTEVTTKTKWIIDPDNSQIGFRVKYLVFTNVRGRFKEFDSAIFAMDGDLSTTEINVRIKAASIDTGNEKRDNHLKSADFFDVDKFKEIRFTATGMEGFANKDGRYVLFGELAMKGTKGQIKLNVESGGVIKDPWGTEKASFNISGKINRKDWGLNWNAALETGGVLVSEDVWIDCEVLLVKQS
jgi:polyisoprenoid-binding protein YceI